MSNATNSALLLGHGETILAHVADDVTHDADLQQTAHTQVSPLCFMHIPKSAGTSFHAALEAALPQGWLAPRRMDSSIFCGFRDFDRLQAATRDLIAADDQEVRSLGRYRAVSGHFSLTALLQITVASAIGTVLREPRARLMSLYMYWRIPKIFDAMRPYRADEYARMPLDRFMAEPSVAAATDNQVCRMLLYGDPRIPNDDFISEADIHAVASDAIARLDTLGFVGVLELGDKAWRGLAGLFGVKLEPRSVNVTSEMHAPVVAIPKEQLFTTDALDLLNRRSAADRLVYDHALTRAGVRHRERRQLAKSAFTIQLAQLGNAVPRALLRSLRGIA